MAPPWGTRATFAAVVTPVGASNLSGLPLPWETRLDKHQNPRLRPGTLQVLSPGAPKQVLILVSLAATSGWRAGRGARGAWGGRDAGSQSLEGRTKVPREVWAGRGRIKCRGATGHLEGCSQ